MMALFLCCFVDQINELSSWVTLERVGIMQRLRTQDAISAVSLTKLMNLAAG